MNNPTNRDQNCVFCSIAARELPAAIVFEDDSVVAFLDVRPVADGHILVIPKSHHASLVEMPPSLTSRVAATLPKLGSALLKATGAAGFNVLCNSGEVAGQVVPHVHFHLIPRSDQDGLGYRWNAKSYLPGKADELTAAYRRELQNLA